jgi:predicted GIY-YIG superfamily endonuclease
MAQHEGGFFEGYTSTRGPLKLVWTEEFPDLWQAIEIERMLKGWSHKKKAALVEGDFPLIHQLAQSPEMRARRARRTEVDVK